LLPALRDDLRITSGAPLISGAPTWVIYDPIRHKYFQIGQRTIEILSRWTAGNAASLRDRLLTERAIRVGDDELERLLAFLRQHSLLELGSPGSAAELQRLEQRLKARTPLQSFQRLIFFRIPLLRPQRFLEATLPFVRPLLTTGFVWLTGLVLLFALYFVSRQYADLLDHARSAFSPAGIVTFVLAISVLKSLHELGHAYHAVSRGLQVPVMGVALMAMFPLLYTDVSDSWRLQRRRDKVMIAAAGVMTEMTVAVYATLAWCFLPDGEMRSAAFAMATSGWFFSLLVNLNPLMRFDGYYLLADTLGVQNLQTRSFAMGRWALRRTLFGVDLPAPEALTNAMRRFMCGYAVAVWIYRFLLFLSIALLLYMVFFKALGIVFLLGSIVAFIGKPVLVEFKEWYGMRKQIAKSPRSWLTFGVLLTGLALLFWPLSTRISVPAVLEYEQQFMIFPPADAQLQEILVSEGMQIAQGDALMRFSDPELQIALEKSRTRLAMHESRILSGAGDATERFERVTLERLVDQERETLSALRDREADLVVHAPGPGIIRELRTDVHPGTWTERKTLLGRIVASGDFLVRGLISEADRERLDLDKPAVFIAEDVLLPSVILFGAAISDYSVERLPDGYLARSSGGRIPVVTPGSEHLVPKGVWYPLNAKIEAAGMEPSSHNSVANRGIVAFRSQPESLARRAWRRIAGVLIRESGF
jgi:putative peptide zinc metalloprotease protein